MSNHVHLVLRPEREDSMAVLLRCVHARYAQRFNRRWGRSGHLWQNRYYSSPLERGHALNALRYVDLNPVRAGLVASARQWRWSSAQAHCSREMDEFGLLDGGWLDWCDWPEWAKFLAGARSEEDARLRRHTGQGRPLGSEQFLRRWEEISGRRLKVNPRGRPRKLPLRSRPVHSPSRTSSAAG